MAASTTISTASYLRLIRHNPNFRRLLFAQMISEMGDWFYSLAIYNLLLEMTGRAESVALAVILQVLPQTFMGPTAGVINDRISRKRVMILADLARIGIVLCMLLARSKSTVWIIYPLLLLETVMASFFEPARSSVIPNIVKDEEAILANTLSSVTWSFDLAVGAMFGGLVAAAFGRDSVFLLNAASFGVSAILIARMRFDEPHVTGTKPFHMRELISLAPVAEGLNYVRRDRRLLYAVCLKAGVGLIGSSWVLLPVMGERVFPLTAPGRDTHQASILSMSVLMAARGMGALVGPLLSARWAGSKSHRLRTGSWLGYACYGVGYGLVFLAPNIWMAALGVVIAHSGGAVVWTFSTTLLQLMTDDNFRGRVFAAELSLCTLTISIATYCVGLALDWGVHPMRVALFTSIASLLPLSLWSIAMMRWEENDGPRQGQQV